MGDNDALHARSNRTIQRFAGQSIAVAYAVAYRARRAMQSIVVACSEARLADACV